MSLDFTVAIPVYNGAKRIPQVLECLRSQIDIETLAGEILVIDNNSHDGLNQVIENIQADWQHPFPLRYLHEVRQGVAFARICAIHAAQGKYIGFLDDDNLAHPTWVRSAYSFGEQYPNAGAYGGQVHALPDSLPPPGFDAIKGFLAIRSLGPFPKPFIPKRLQLPVGAGLVVRKQAWLDSMPQSMIRPGMAGDDYEISLHMYNYGWEIWYNPAMVIDHQIPPHRMEASYLNPLAHLYGLCSCELQMIVTPLWQRPFVLIKNFLGSAKRLITHSIHYRYARSTDLAADCQLAFFWGSLLSPGFYLKNASQRFWQRIVTPDFGRYQSKL